jgi:hypothetical protein
MSIWLNPKYSVTSPSIAAKYLFNILKKIDVQRSSLNEGSRTPSQWEKKNTAPYKLWVYK